MGAMAVYRLAEMRPEDHRRIMARATAEIFDEALNDSVREIIEDVRLRGDEALVGALERFDGVSCTADRLRVTEEEIAAARTQVSEEVVRAIRQGITNIRAFNKRILEGASWQKEVAPGLVIGEQVRSGRVRCALRAEWKGLVSLCAHADRHAGGSRRRSSDRRRCPAGVGRGGGSCRSGGARGRRGARPHRRLPFERPGRRRCGRSRHRVESLGCGWSWGLGSPAVTAAQIQVQALAGCRTVMLFGPSESLVIADECADPTVLAADLMNEAEHGAIRRLSWSRPPRRCSLPSGSSSSGNWPSCRATPRGYADSQLSPGSEAPFSVADLAEACAFANEYAPEHLQIVTEEPRSTPP